MLDNRPHTVLFICTGNYYRSRFAEALFNYYADLSHLLWRAISRGLTPHLIRGEVSPYTQDALVVRGIPLAYIAPQKQALTAQDLKDADRIIALKESEHRPLMRLYFPDWVDRVEYWSGDNTNRLAKLTALPLIESQVQELIADLIGNRRAGY